MRLTIEHVTIRHGATTAVADFTATYEPGVHALLGPNGAGKSSLMQVLATLTTPSAGAIDLDGASGVDMRPYLGYLPQDNLPKSRFTVREHLLYMCWLKRVPRPAAEEEVGRLLELTELNEHAHHRIAALSGGMRRRVGIASALVAQPRLLLLDEASAGLDLAQRAVLQRIIDTVSSTTIVVTSTHIVEDIADIADTVTILNHGNKVFSGPWESFSSTRELKEIKSRYMALLGQS